MSQQYQSKVPPKSVRLLRDEEVSYVGENGNKEIWEVKDYTVTMVTNVRAYNCTCRFGSVHADKDGICKHVAAVELYKTMSFLSPSIVEEVKEE